MRRIVLTFGLISGGIVSLLLVVSMAFADRIGVDRGEIIGYTSMILSFLLVFFGIRTYRDDAAGGGGTISFRRAFTVGLLITLVASACYVVTWVAIEHTIGRDFGAKYAATLLARAKASGATPEQLTVRTREIARQQELYANPVINVAITFLEIFPVGLVMTLVSAAILRRRSPRPDTTPATVIA